MAVRGLVKRDSDGSTIDLAKEEAEHADITANAKKVKIVDDSGSDVTNSNPLPVTSVTNISSNLEGKGIVSVGTTAVELTFSGVTESISIQADDSNTGVIYVGKSDVTNLGANAIVKLQPGWSVKIDYDDSTNAIYVVSDTVSQNVITGALK